MKSFNHIYSSETQVSYFRPLGFLREKLGVEKTMIDGRSVSQSVIKIDDPSTRYKGLCGNDFVLENQLAAGVNLKPCMFNPSTREIESNLLRGMIKIQNEKQSLNTESNEN